MSFILLYFHYSFIASSSESVHLPSSQVADFDLVTDQSEQGYAFQRPHSAQSDLGHAVFKHFGT